MKTYKARWSPLLKVVTIAVTLLFVGIAISTLVTFANQTTQWSGAITLSVLICFGTPLICALFMVRGYRITDDSIIIPRPFRTTQVPLAGLQSAVHSTDAMKRSIRLMGNGGLFVFCGYFYNSMWGRYQAFVTDHKSIVVLKYDSGKVVMLSPDQPEDFIREISPFLKAA